jgi:hypothetical protein
MKILIVMKMAMIINIVNRINRNKNKNKNKNKKIIIKIKIKTKVINMNKMNKKYTSKINNSNIKKNKKNK